MGWNGSKSGFLGTKMGQKWVETHFWPIFVPISGFSRKPIFSASLRGGNCFLKRALKQSRPSLVRHAISLAWCHTDVGLNRAFGPQQLGPSTGVKKASSKKTQEKVRKGVLGASRPRGEKRSKRVEKWSEVNKRGRPSKWPPECLPSKFADFECAFSL